MMAGRRRRWRRHLPCGESKHFTQKSVLRNFCGGSVVRDLGRLLVEAGWEADENQHRVVRLSADFADSDEWALAGYSTAGRWIADQLDVTMRTANEWIRVGRALRSLRLTSQALRDRVISFTKAKVLTRTATESTEHELMELAQRVTAAELPKAIAWWSQRSEPDAVIDERQAQVRSLRWQVEIDGSVLTTVRLPPGGGSVLMAAVDAMVMRQSQQPVDHSGQWPSLAQQRADALVELLQSGGAGLQVEVVLHVRGDGATLDDGTPITQSSIAELLPDSFVRALVHDADGRPINASARRRYPTTRQRRVVKERDRACVDCGSHDLLEFDHVPAYAQTGHTIVEELQLRCAPCHRFRHANELGRAQAGSGGKTRQSMENR